MAKANIFIGVACALGLALAACSGEQSDWEKARTSNNAESYESFVKKYPNGSFAPQAQARLKELYEERDWQKARDADSPESYQSFLKQYPEGKWAEEARIRVENFNLAQTPGGAPGAGASPAASAAESAVPALPAGVTPSATAQKPAAPPAKSPAQPAAKTAAATGGAYGVQLGAFTSGAAAADRHWARLAKKYPSALSGLTPKVRKSRTAKGHLYRLQVTGLAHAAAGRICKELKAKGDGCAVLKPRAAKRKATAHAKKQ